jgi:hypothetical protein
VGALFENRMLDALAKSLVCFAILHQVVLGAHLVQHRDWSVLNIFTMLEAQKLFPELAAGGTMQWVSLGFGLVVYGLALVLLARRGTVRDGADFRITRIPIRVVSRRADRRVRPWRPGLAAGIVAFFAGVAMHMLGLELVERFVTTFPAVPDVVHMHLPYVDFGVFGELCFAGFLATAVTVHVRSQARAVAGVLVMLGLFYAGRGLFLLLLPVGSPPTAPALADRFVFYPYASHGYFPGGHAGLMTVLSLSLADPRWRRALLGFTVIFAFGTVLARTHYAADAVGGCLLGAGIVAWGRRRLGVAAAARRAVATFQPRVFAASRHDGRHRTTPQPRPIDAATTRAPG